MFTLKGNFAAIATAMVENQENAENHFRVFETILGCAISRVFNGASSGGHAR